MNNERRPRGFDSGAAQNPIDRVLAILPDAKPSGKGWTAQCPAHFDTTPSLSINVGDDGRVLLHCHSGCSQERVCAAMGISLRDLFRTSSFKKAGQSQPKKDHRTKPTISADTRDELVDIIAREGDPTIYEYPNDLAVVRIENAGKAKTFRPIHKNGDVWVLGDPDGLLPLYHADELQAGVTVFVCEGEKDVDRGRECGLTAVTSAHGANSAHKSDWSALAGHEVIIIPHNDDAGRKFARAVATILTTLDNPATVRIINLPGLPEHGDLLDFAAKRTPVQVRAEIEKLVAVAPIEFAPVVDGRSDSQSHWRPFPLDSFPPIIREYVERGASAIGCDPTFIALPMLSMIASAVGTTRRIKIKNSWHEAAMCWTVVIAKSGTLKSPALDYALAPLKRIQSRRFQEHPKALAEHVKAKARYDADFAKWRSMIDSDRGDPPEEPKPPTRVRHIVTDITVEALATVLQDNPRGVLLARDELDGWFGSFDKYRQKNGGDSAQWLEVHRAGHILIDRKTGPNTTIFVPMAGVSITGTIQPSVIGAALGSKHFEDGLASRLLMANPPSTIKRWRDDDIDDAWTDRIGDLLEELLRLEHTTNRHGDLVPIGIPFDAEAKQKWIVFYNEHARTQHEAATEDLAAAFSKLEGYAARFALLFHLVRCAASPDCAPSCIDAQSIKAGIRLARWFVFETERVYDILAESREEALLRELLTFIRSKGGRVSVRDVQRGGPRELRKPVAAPVAALDSLVADGLGEWEYLPPGSKGGAPSKILRLYEFSGDNDKTKA